MRYWTLLLCSLSLIGCASWGTQERQKADLHLRLGVSQLESENYPMALREFLKAEELDPNNPVIHNNLGQVYFLRDRLELSEKHFRRAISLSPKYSDARNNLGRLLIEKGDYKNAEKEINAVIDDLTYPSPQKAYINLGLAKFNQKQYSQAQEAFAKVLEMAKDDCVANNYFGRTFFELKDYPRAAESLDRAIGFCQRSLFDEPHYYSALAYYRMGERSRAIARFEELIKYYPSGKFREKSKGMLSLIRKGH